MMVSGVQAAAKIATTSRLVKRISNFLVRMIFFSY
jgi:hypothetical protein